jgi:hypothetical protein
VESNVTSREETEITDPEVRSQQARGGACGLFVRSQVLWSSRGGPFGSQAALLRRVTGTSLFRARHVAERLSYLLGLSLLRSVRLPRVARTVIVGPPPLTSPEARDSFACSAVETSSPSSASGVTELM